MLEAGYATREDIDAAMMNGCNHPMGPLALLDLVGNDVSLEIVESLYSEFRDPVHGARAAAQADGRGRPARTEDRPRVLRLREVGERSSIHIRSCSHTYRSPPFVLAARAVLEGRQRLE